MVDPISAGYCLINVADLSDLWYAIHVLNALWLKGTLEENLKGMNTITAVIKCFLKMWFSFKP